MTDVAGGVHDVRYVKEMLRAPSKDVRELKPTERQQIRMRLQPITQATENGWHFVLHDSCRLYFN